MMFILQEKKHKMGITLLYDLDADNTQPFDWEKVGFWNATFDFVCQSQSVRLGRGRS